MPRSALFIRRLLRLVAEVVRESVRTELAAMSTEPAPGPAALLSYVEVAGILGVSKRTVERLVDRGELGTVRAGSAPRVHPDALDAYVRFKAAGHGQRRR
ncbi:MAG TPA: helix-turn-helix domain-containing protein [Rubricoccaceae bacterium]